MYHFFLNKGFKLDYLLNLKTSEKAFFFASMEVAKEEELNKLKALIGVKR